MQRSTSFCNLVAIFHGLVHQSLQTSGNSQKLEIIITVQTRSVATRDHFERVSYKLYRIIWALKC